MSLLTRQIFLTIFTYVTVHAYAQSAILFGASGTVGSEVLRTLVQDEFWKEVVLIGRKVSPKVEEILSEAGDNDDNMHVTQISLPDLTNVDQNKSLLESEAIRKADACFIAVGAGYPHELSLFTWHKVDVEMICSMARLCNKVQVKHIALLSASEVENEPTPFSQDELNESETNPIGWLKMVKFYARMKGLGENAVIEASGHIPFIRLFQPSTIVTEDIRYGWVDWTLFHLHKFLDPIMPYHYHSVPAKLLGMAIANDAGEILRDEGVSVKRVMDLHYLDYIRVAGTEYNQQKEKENMKENKEL